MKNDLKMEKIRKTETDIRKENKMERKIKTLYVIHHSHTDIGYTDLQERVIDTQVDYIHTVLKMMK